MSVIARQRRVSSDHIHDMGVTYPNGVALHRTTVDTPPTGYYYVNEDRALYIFSERDARRGVTMRYINRSQARVGDRKINVAVIEPEIHGTSQPAGGA